MEESKACYRSCFSAAGTAALADSSTLEQFEQVRGSASTSGCKSKRPRRQDAESPFAPNGCSVVLMLMSTESSQAGQGRAGVKEVEHLPHILCVTTETEAVKCGQIEL